MLIAIQTISWGTHPPDVKRMLAEAKDAGYTGVEFAQHPQELGTPAELYEKLTSLDLTLVGIAGGSLDEKMTFVRGYVAWRKEHLPASGLMGISPDAPQALAREQPYIYIDEWDDQGTPLALGQGFMVALHPHMFKSVQTVREAEGFLLQHPKLRFLPDTAHLTVAGDDVLSAISRNYDRLAAVHLKDWTAEYGRSYQFYARGFVGLGKGDVPLLPVLDLLKSKGYSGWLVVEQDASPKPFESAKSSRDWLRTACGI